MVNLVAWSDSGLVFLTTGCVYIFLLYHTGVLLRDVTPPWDFYLMSFSVVDDYYLELFLH